MPGLSRQRLSSSHGPERAEPGELASCELERNGRAITRTRVRSRPKETFTYPRGRTQGHRPACLDSQARPAWRRVRDVGKWEQPLPGRPEARVWRVLRDPRGAVRPLHPPFRAHLPQERRGGFRPARPLRGIAPREMSAIIQTDEGHLVRLRRPRAGEATVGEDHRADAEQD